MGKVYDKTLKNIKDLCNIQKFQGSFSGQNSVNSGTLILRQVWAFSLRQNCRVITFTLRINVLFLGEVFDKGYLVTTIRVLEYRSAAIRVSE